MLRKAQIVEKPWGHEEIWAQASRYMAKILFIKNGHRLSRQLHRTKEETIMVLEGVLTCELGPTHAGGAPTVHKMGPGEICHVIPNTIHRFGADEGDVRLVEASTPENSDVERLEDDYRRITNIPWPPPADGK